MFKSTVVARMLGVSYYTLFELLRGGKLSAPGKDSSGDYVWSEADVERARRALAARRRAPVAAGTDA